MVSKAVHVALTRYVTKKTVTIEAQFKRDEALGNGIRPKLVTRTTKTLSEYSMRLLMAP
jgi:hypothetical protein